VDSLQAQFLVVHCNPLQEAIQPEGTPQFKGGLAALQNLTSQLKVPVVLKETGCGFSSSNFIDLKDLGFQPLMSVAWVEPIGGVWKVSG
jgi:isopentenyl-diphosphate delta-isomerase